MKKWFVRGAWTIAVILVLVIVLAVIVPIWISPNEVVVPFSSSPGVGGGILGQFLLTLTLLFAAGWILCIPWRIQTDLAKFKEQGM